MTTLRKAIFAGSWYPKDIKEIKSYLSKENVEQKLDVLGCICPHAGWIYSGKVAGSVYSKIQPADVYIIIGPNHTGMGQNSAVYPEGFWQTPIGDIEVNKEFVELLLNNSKIIKEDKLPHIQEHSIEVQLPFLKVIADKDFTIVPISLKIEDYASCKQIGQEIAKTVIEYKKTKDKKFILIASTDMTHYQTDKEARELDKIAINQILKFSEKGLYDAVFENGISMCGVFPTVCVMVATKILGAKKAQLIKYQTSADVSGDYSQVVGYAGIVIY